MPQQCEICQKKKRAGNRRSHSNIATRRSWKVNLQQVSIGAISARICTRCLKTLTKTASVPRK